MKYEDRVVSPKDSIWIFVAGGGSEIRHLYDIVLGIDSLRKIGVNDDNIYVFSDFPQTSLELNSFNITKNIFDTSLFQTELPKIESMGFAFVVVTGHGYSQGIPLLNAPPISPSVFLSSIRSIKNLEACICILGQCYAGVFNLTDAFSHPMFVLLGGTNLNLSLSLGVTIDHPIQFEVEVVDEKGNQIKEKKGLDTWGANIFLFYFFEWLRHPKDIDGDGVLNIMDAYKYAGVEASDRLRQRKCELFIEVEAHKSDQLTRLVQSKRAETQEKQIELLLEIHSSQKVLNDILEILHLHQEPWILHANYARHLIFKFEKSQ